MLVDTNNTELTYTIPQATTIYAGDNRITDIQFAINGQFQVTKKSNFKQQMNVFTWNYEKC